ncbi:DNA ligase 4 [Pseudolycoriella hygida]|uniref:DNA ligase (ATP) n=1 Tax=Pseudolycoriella hygida TaxID=35572 RepID=A0A9Q0S165_9DIPT|nr:DNA ligase 4 [Pseudolycoriella hygida]
MTKYLNNSLVDMDTLPKPDISTKVKFSKVSGTLERIHGAKTLPKKVSILKGYFESFREFQSTFTSTEANCYSSFYPVLRLILPKQDRDRDSYGIKTFAIGKIYVRILGVHDKSDVAKRLTAKCSDKDFPDVVYDVMKNRCCKVGELTVADVNKHLDTIAFCYKNNERKKIDDEIIKMVEGMTALDQKWLIRMILKEMYLGIKSAKILTTYHPSAKHFQDQYTSLSRVCQAVESGEVYQEGGSVELFRRCNPMLCKRGTVETLQTLLNQSEFYLETKMDGERFHIHVKDGEFKYFSRRGYEFNSFGSSRSDGSLTPFIQPLFKIPIKNLILDGEMMVWNREYMIYHTKGENFDVKSIQPNNSTVRPCFCAYDVLYLNDQSLIDKPYAERIRVLATIFNEKPGVLTMCKPIKIRDSDHIIECLNKAFDQKEEGVVIKQGDSVYAPGKRIDSWIKIKPDYIDGLVSDFDLLVIGGYNNPSNKFVYKYLVGVQKKSLSKSEFVAVANISSGLSASKRIEVNEKLKPYWKNCSHTKSGRSIVVNNPPGMDFGAQTPDVWIQPEHSIIFESNSKVEKAVKRHITDADINATATKRSRQSAKETKTKFTTSSNVGNINLLHDNIQKLDGICDGKEFCVLNTASHLPTLDELHKMILRHAKRTFVCIAATESLRVTKLKEIQMCNIATVNWLVRAVGANVPLKKLISFHPNEMIFCTEETGIEFQRKYDIFSDSFTKKVSTDELKSIFKTMDGADLETLSRNSLYELEAELADGVMKKILSFLKLGQQATARQIWSVKWQKLYFGHLSLSSDSHGAMKKILSFLKLDQHATARQICDAALKLVDMAPAKVAQLVQSECNKPDVSMDSILTAFKNHFKEML